MSNVDKFVLFTIAKQLTIAKTVVNSTRPVVLFDRSFLTDHVIMVDKIRVEVDAAGRHAILSAGAQNAFTFSDYCRFLPPGYNYLKANDTPVSNPTKNTNAAQLGFSTCGQLLQHSCNCADILKFRECRAITGNQSAGSATVARKVLTLLAPRPLYRYAADVYVDVATWESSD
ncbi:hypothetical protein ACLKA6_011349 [Drosophila palustris]